MRVLVTGGAGFIGQQVARRLAGEHDVVALDSLSAQVHRDPTASVARFPGTVVSGDVAEEAAWRDLPAFDAVIHLAAETGTAQSMYERERYRRVNVDGTRLAALAARTWGAPLVVLSSRAVYGEGRYRTSDGAVVFGQRPGPDATPEGSTETDDLVPVSVYGESKAAAEALVAPFAADVPVVILRPQNVVGHGQSLHNPYTGVLAAFLARLREGRPVQVYGDGHETRDFVHVSDVADLIVWSLGHPGGQQPLVLNAGTGVRTSLLDLARFAIDAAPRGGTVEHIEVRRAGDIEHACADLSGLVAAGAPLPAVSSQDAVAEFIQRGWTADGAAASVWDDALAELRDRGLAT